jgi:hypothetical protein
MANCIRVNIYKQHSANKYRDLIEKRKTNEVGDGSIWIDDGDRHHADTRTLPCEASLELDRAKTNRRPSSGALAICARPSEKTPAPARRSTASGSGGGICLRTALSKDSVGVGHLRTLVGGSSALARGKRGYQSEHSQFYCSYHFLSHDRRGGPLTGSQSNQGPSFVSRRQKRADNLPSRVGDADVDCALQEIRRGLVKVVYKKEPVPNAPCFLRCSRKSVRRLTNVICFRGRQRGR